MLTISQARSGDDIAALRHLVRAFTTWAISLDPGSENAPTFRNLEEEIATLPGQYAPRPGRSCWPACRNGRSAALPFAICNRAPSR